jgi:hypothetical protein
MEGTKQFRRRGTATTEENAAPKAPDAPLSPAEPSEKIARVENEIASPDAANLDRRAWFRALLPAAGDGLVKLLRASNNLQRDVHEVLQSASGSLLEDDRGQPKK